MDINNNTAIQNMIFSLCLIINWQHNKQIVTNTDGIQQYKDMMQ